MGAFVQVTHRLFWPVSVSILCVNRTGLLWAGSLSSAETGTHSTAMQKQKPTVHKGGLSCAGWNFPRVSLHPYHTSKILRTHQATFTWKNYLQSDTSLPKPYWVYDQCKIVTYLWGCSGHRQARWSDWAVRPGSPKPATGWFCLWQTH